MDEIKVDSFQWSDLIDELRTISKNLEEINKTLKGN